MSIEQSINRNKSINPDWQDVITHDVRAKRWSQYCQFSPFQQFLQNRSRELEERPKVEFCTGSSYEGQWDSVGMCGVGKYVFPHGVEYYGQFWDGMFDGHGIMKYPAGQRIDGIWEKGILISYRYRFADGLLYTDPWDYCQMPDREFFLSMQEGINPAGEEYLTQQHPTRNIPENCYDLNDGFYDAKRRYVFSDKLKDSAIDRIENEWEENVRLNASRVPDQEKIDWITAHCRKAWDESVGHRPDLFEYWTGGRMAEMEKMAEIQKNLHYEIFPSSTGNSDYSVGKPDLSECWTSRKLKEKEEIE